MSTPEATFLCIWLDSVLDGKSARTRESYAYVVPRLDAFLAARSYLTDLRQLKPRL